MRVYTIEFDKVAVTAVQDLVTILCGASAAVELHSVQIGQQTATSVGNLAIRIKRMPATVTAGSGGTTPTPQKARSGDAAATATAHVNDTTQTTTSGTAVILETDDFNVINGWGHNPAPEDRFAAGLNEAIIIELETAPGSSETVSGTVKFAELVPV